MSAAGYVTVGYAVTSVALVAYVARVVVRARRLGRVVPPQERPWSSSK